MRRLLVGETFAHADARGEEQEHERAEDAHHEGLVEQIGERLAAHRADRVALLVPHQRLAQTPDVHIDRALELVPRLFGARLLLVELDEDDPERHGLLLYDDASELRVTIDLFELMEEPLVDGTAITLQFLEGEVAGFAGCNSYKGNYVAEQNEDGTYNVAISDLQLTQIACPEEIAYRMRYISADELEELALAYGDSGYGLYLQGVLQDER